jgi:hypothetical protein
MAGDTRSGLPHEEAKNEHLQAGVRDAYLVKSQARSTHVCESGKNLCCHQVGQERSESDKKLQRHIPRDYHKDHLPSWPASLHSAEQQPWRLTISAATQGEQAVSRQYGRISPKKQFKDTEQHRK